MPAAEEAAPPSGPDVEAYKAVRAHELMLNQATAAFEHAAIAPLLLINGGGAVAYLTLLGASADKEASLPISVIWAVGAIAAWSAGLVVGAGAARLGLLRQQAFSKAHRYRREVAEQVLLAETSMADALKPDGYSPERWGEKRCAEKARGDTLGRRYQHAIALSIAFFVGGAACAAISVL